MKNSEDAPLRIKSVSRVLARVPSNANTASTASLRATLKTPSRRLSCFFSIAFEADANEVPNAYGGSTWSARAIRPNRNTGKKGQLHLLVNGQALPNGYELDSAIREILLTATLGVPVRADGTTVVPGNWVLLVEWEPNMPQMCEQEITDLFGDCDATVNGTESTMAA